MAGIGFLASQISAAAAMRCFYFDENQGVTPGGDDIDFAERAFPAPRQNAIAMHDQPWRRRGFLPKFRDRTRFAAAGSAPV
jgi:hypothetical protein